MKPFQIIVLAVFGMSALVGLVFFATSKGLPGGGAQVGDVVVWGTLPQTALETTLAEITSTDKRFAGVVYTEMAPESFGTELAQAIAEGSGPDLILITQEQLLSERAKLNPIPYAEYPERTYVDTYVPMAELFLAPEGIYGIPVVIDPLVLYYNQTALSSAGIASPPTSWEAVNGMAELMTDATQAGAVAKSVVPFGDYTNVANAHAIISLLLFQAGVPISVVTDLGVEAVLVSGEGIENTSAALNFYTQFANPTKSVYTWNSTRPYSRDAFISGDLVLYPGFASEELYLRTANPNLTFDMAPIPQPSIATTKMTYGELYAAAIPRASFNPSGALEVAFVLGSQRGSSLVASQTGTAPALRALLVAPPEDRFAGVYYPEALRARGWLSPSMSVTDGIFAGMIGNITSGRRSIEESIQTADDSLDAALP